MFSNQFGAEKRALLLSPHTDDCEITMGGTIARLIEDGYNIEWMVFSNSWQSLPDGFDKDTLPREQLASAAAFGISSAQVTQYDFETRRFPQYRQEILELMVAKSREFNPSVVFCPTLQDCHQDHATIAQEAVRAFKRKTLLGYISTWNVTHEIRTYYVEVKKTHIEKKLKALSSYKSQMHRPYMGDDQINTMMKACGIQVGVEHAEAFETIRSISLVC